MKLPAPHSSLGVPGAGESAASVSRTPRSGIEWSAFLGVSWTWCIGMFLPVLLVRDYGFAGFLVFAIPNVVGAAAMGKLLPDAQSSRQFVERHGLACAAFSSVTVVFHLFFVAWVIHALVGQAAYLITAGLLAILLMVFVSERWTVVTAWLVLIGSLIAFGFVASHAPGNAAEIQLFGSAPSLNLLGLAPVCIVGFFLNPYLDLTFHRARQATSPRGGVVAFAFGFGGCFASMILFTLRYAHLLDPSRWNAVSRPLAWAIALHMMLQSAFTIAAHLRSLFLEWTKTTRDGVIGGGIAAACLLILWGVLGSDPTSSEMVYRLFMGFYGLIFPAYLWTTFKGVSRRALAVCAIAIIVSAPMFWLGFIDSRMLWLIPGIGLVLCGWFFTSAGPAPVLETAGPSPSRHAEATNAP